MRVGSLFSGYGGLDMAVGGEVVWYSEIEPAACKVLAAHHPGVPNLGDIKKVDWSTVAPIDVLTGGYPCQPFSNAGMRRGKDDERHLWPYVKDAISALRPRLAVLENVRGHLSMGLADVIGDLAGLGYDAQWGLVRAADAGAPHGRARVFITAYPNSLGSQGREHETGKQGLLKAHACVGTFTTNSDRANVPDTDSAGSEARVEAGHDGKCAWIQFVGLAAPTADARSERHGERQDHRVVGRVGSPSEVSGRTPSTSRQEPAHRGPAHDVDWGKYRPAVSRWEALTRPAPSPTFTGNDGRARLAPIFVEWMMGLPEGHVTGHGLSTAQELKMLGNGVCPQQAKLAIQLLTEWGTK